jgi:hypothetical protein
MSGNSNPIYSRVGDIQGVYGVSAAAADYTGAGANNVPVFTADYTNGGYVQRLRFKSLGTNTAGVVARIYINDNDLGASGALFLTSPLTTASIFSATPSATGGSLYPGTFYGKVQTVDQWGGVTGFSTETSAVVTGSGSGSITWNWNAVTGATSYRLYTGPTSNAEVVFFTTTTNSFVQTNPVIPGEIASPAQYQLNNYFIGEVSLPATNASTSAATPDIDYPLNIALPPGYRILVGLGASPSGPGWSITAIGGKY